MSDLQPTLNYHIRKGKSTAASTPCIVLLHGYGSNKDDLFSFQSYLPKDHTIIALEAPHQLMENGFAWYALHFDAADGKWSDFNQARESMQTIRQHLQYCIATYQLAPKKITLLGFSQGAILSWALKLNYPKEFHRIIALSGYVPQELLPIPLTSVRDICAFASHGTEDQVLPVYLARETVAPLVENNPQLAYHEYPQGHTIGNDNFIALLAWIEATTNI